MSHSEVLQPSTTVQHKMRANSPSRRTVSTSPKTSRKQIIHILYQEMQKVLKPTQLSSRYSTNQMRSAGFQYNETSCTYRCEQCDLELSDCSSEMAPASMHAQHSPRCPFVLQYLFMPNSESDRSSDHQENSYEVTRMLIEVDKLQKIRYRSYSHWKGTDKPSSDRMIAAGFFSCNIHDRTICIYCNLICHEWNLDEDDPVEAHRVFSPQCPYVLSILNNSLKLSLTVVRNGPTDSNSEQLETIERRSTSTDCSYPAHPTYSDLKRRMDSFISCSNQSALPPVDDLAMAGFFYRNEKDLVTCFFCNGSLKNWSSHDQPIVEHVRWFDRCGYAKKQCGDPLYQQIIVAKQTQPGKRAVVSFCATIF